MTDTNVDGIKRQLYILDGIRTARWKDDEYLARKLDDIHDIITEYLMTIEKRLAKNETN